VRGDSILIEKLDDHSLAMLHQKGTFNVFSPKKWQNDDALDRMLDTNLIYPTFRRLNSLKIY
jgi:hypothetical protein